MNSSDSPGYLTPTSTLSPEDIDPEALLRPWIAGLSGLAEAQIISRWPTGPSAPLAAETTFCEFGIVTFQADTAPIFIHQTDEQCQFWRTEVLECLLSFSGPHGLQRVLQFRDGLCVSQNNDILNAQGLSVVDSGRVLFCLSVASLNKWGFPYGVSST